jgi:hypothetical protein
LILPIYCDRPFSLFRLLYGSIIRYNVNQNSFFFLIVEYSLLSFSMIDQPNDLYTSSNSQQIPHYQTMTNLLSSSYLSSSPTSATLATLPPSSSSLSSSSSSPSSTTNCTHHDLFYPSSIYHLSAEVIVSSHRPSLMNSTHTSPFHYHHQQKLRNRPSEQTDSDCDLDSSSNSILSSSSSTTNINITNSSSSKLKKRRANLPKDSVRLTFISQIQLTFSLGSNIKKLAV